jgi:hypothetical protein
MKFNQAIPLPPIERLGRSRQDNLRIATTDTETHLNITLDHDRLSLQPCEAKSLRNALNEAYPDTSETFSTIARGDMVTVQLTVTKVDTRHGVTMFSTDCTEWFEAHDAIGYVAPPHTPIKAGQVRRVGHCKTDYLILITPDARDNVVVGRADGPDSNPVLLERPAVEAASVVS